MHNRLVLLAFFMGALILSSCGGTVPEATATMVSPTSSATQIPDTSTPTKTPVPSRTSLPTETSAPTQTPTATPPTFVRENTPLPLPEETISAENASQLVELARLGKGRIVDVQLSPDRAFLIVQTTIGVYGYRASTMEEAWAFEDPSGIADLALPRLARWMAVATNDNRIALLIYKRGSLFTKFVSGFQQIDDLAFSPDDRLLAAVGDAGVAIWEVGQTEPLYRNIDLVGEVIGFTPDGESITISHGSQLDVFSFSEDQLVKSISVKRRLTYSRLGEQYTDGFGIWDATDHEKLIDLVMVEEGRLTNTRSFSYNGTYLAMGIDRGGGAYSVGIWRVSTGKLLSVLNSPPSSGFLQNRSRKLAAPALAGLDLSYSQVAFSPDGSMMVAASPQGYVDLWDLTTNTFKYRYAGLGDNLLFISGDRLTIWDSTEIQEITPQQGYLIHKTSDFVAGRILNFSLDGRWLFADGVFWEMGSLQRAARFEDEIVSAVSPDGEYLYSFDLYQHTINQRRMEGFDLAEKVELAWDFDVSFEGKSRFFWFSEVNNFAISPDGGFFTIRLDSPETVFWNLPENRIVKELSGDFTSRGYFSPDGKKFAISGSDGILIYNLMPEIFLQSKIEARFTCGFSPDGGKLLVRVGEDWYLYDLQANGEWDQEMRLNVNLSPANCGAFNSAGTLLAVNSGNDFAMVDLSTGRHTILASNDPIASIAFSPDGHYLATASYDGTVKLWGIP